MPANVTSSDIITQEAVRQTVNEAVEENLVFMQAFRDLDISGIANDTITLPQDDDTMAEPEHVPENTHFPRDEEDVSTITAKVDKYGLEVAISMESEADSLFDVVQMQVDRKARKMQEFLNQQAYTELSTNLHANSPAANSTDNVLGFDDVTEGLKELRNSGYSPDLMFVGPQGERDILNDPDFNRATDAGDVVVRRGPAAIGTFAGVDVIMENDGHLTTSDAILVDSSEYGFFVHKGGIQTDEYEDEATQSRVFRIWSRHTFKAEDGQAAILVNGDA